MDVKDSAARLGDRGPSLLKRYQCRWFRSLHYPCGHECRRGMRQVRIDKGEASGDSICPSSRGTSLTLDYQRASSFPISISLHCDVYSTNMLFPLP
jgi:hypothetical protein